MFAPVSNTYRITVEQVVLLKPALVEICILTLITNIKGAFDIVVALKVSYEMAIAFLLGHLR